MKPRCQGAKTPGHFTSFECVLNEGHDGFCEPYVPPTADEYRLMEERTLEAARQRYRASQAIRENARLQAELDALRAILASGCDACAHATPKHPISQESTLAEMRGMLDDEPGKAET